MKKTRIKIAAISVSLIVGVGALTVWGGTKKKQENNQVKNESFLVSKEKDNDKIEENKEIDDGKIEENKKSIENQGPFSNLPEGIKSIKAEEKAYPELENLIIEHFEIPDEYLEKTRYYYNYVDLNDDGNNEIFVVVMGPYTSGTGGSSALIVNPVGEELCVNQGFTLMRTPIIISDTKTKGAKEIIVENSGGVVESNYVALTCSDGYYTNVPEGRAVESLEGITGTAIITNDILQEFQEGKALTLKK